MTPTVPPEPPDVNTGKAPQVRFLKAFRLTMSG